MIPVVKGLFGGTFDPPHFGHLALANAALHQLELHEILFVTAGDPWQKAGSDVTDARLRLAMTHLAAAEDARFTVSDVEVLRDGPTYTIDTVEEIGTPCTLILGSEAAVGIPSWHRSGELLDLVDLAVVERGSVPIAEVESAIGREVIGIEMAPIGISSTDIRDHVGRGASPRFLVPDSIAEFIVANQLYR